MDAFTEKILARARERQKMLEVYTNDDKKTNCDCSDLKLKDKKEKESLSDSNITQTIQTSSPLRENNSESNLSRFCRQNSRTRVSSDIPGSPKTKLKTLNIQQDDFNMEIKVTSAEDVRVEIEIGEQEHSESSNSNQGSPKSDCGLRNESKKKLNQLGKLYAGGEECDISSPIHKNEAKFCEQSLNSNSFQSKRTPLKPPGSGLKKLAHLAEAINQWEDDIHPAEKKVEFKKSVKQKAPQPPSDVFSVQTVTSKTPIKAKAPQPPNDKTNTEKENCMPKKEPIPQSTTIEPGETSVEFQSVKAKKINWDRNILESLESQGFTRTESNSRLVYAYNSKDANSDVKVAQKSSVCKQNSNVIPEDEEDISKIKHREDKLQSESVTSKIARKFESTVNDAKSPTKAKAACPPNSPSKYIKSGNIADKAAIFEVSSPSKTHKDPALLSVSERKALFERNKGEVLVPKAPFGMAPPVKVESVMQASKTKIITEGNIISNKQKDDRISESVNDIEVTKTENINKIAKTTEVLINRNEKPIITREIRNVKPVVHDTVLKATHKDNNFQSGGIASRVAALMQNKSTISESQIESGVKSQRQKDMDMLLNRFHRNKEVSNEAIIEEELDDEEYDATEETAMLPGKGAKVVIANDVPQRKSAEKRKSGGKICSTEDSPVVTAILEDVKRIKVSPAKAGRLYPNLSDIEATTETETRTPSPEDHHSSFGDDGSESDDDPNTSFGRDILETVCKNQLTPIKRPIFDESTASDLSSILEDDYLDDLSNEDNSSPGPTPPKLVCHKTPQKTEMQPSSSFNYKSFNTPNKFGNTSKNNFASPLKSPPRKSSDLQTYVVEGDNVMPLTHTVSFYRKQQNQVQTPVRQIMRLPSTEESQEESLPEEAKAVEQKIKEMKDEVHKQQNIISQTSQALNLCSSTPEFSGSTEQVEAERVLLLATHRRQAALHELQRLKVENSLRPQSQIGRTVPLEKGTLTISNIVLPLKQKYVKALAAAGGKGHHVVCLIKCGEQVVPTKLVSTVVSNATNPDTELMIPGSITLKNIYSDFTITFEVYCLQAQEEFLPHEVKYHINKKGSSKLVTPKKSKQDSRMVMPIKESPAGPQAVRTSSFAMMGYIVFSVQAINKKVWSLNNTPPMSPLEGTVEMRISCELAVSVEHRGFLTMFEDVSGFGAWHRRWCLLKKQGLSYWKYPDEEKKKAPIDTIDLQSCITKNVGPVSRDICARLHTFLFETERDALPHDKDSLITVRKGDKTVIRHLLSADTKEERIEWCAKFNAALTALRMWGKSQ